MLRRLGSVGSGLARTTLEVGPRIIQISGRLRRSPAEQQLLAAAYDDDQRDHSLGVTCD